MIYFQVGHLNAGSNKVASNNLSIFQANFPTFTQNITPPCISVQHIFNFTEISYLFFFFIALGMNSGSSYWAISLFSFLFLIFKTISQYLTKLSSVGLNMCFSSFSFQECWDYKRTPTCLAINLYTCLSSHYDGIEMSTDTYLFHC